MAAVALYILLDLMSWLNDKFNSMGLHIMASYFYVLITESGEIAVLTHAEMVAISADEASTDDWFHITCYTFVVIVSGKTVCQ